MQTKSIDPLTSLRTAGPARRRAKNKGETRRQVAREAALVLLLYWLLEELGALAAGLVESVNSWPEAGQF